MFSLLVQTINNHWHQMLYHYSFPLFVLAGYSKNNDVWLPDRNQPSLHFQVCNFTGYRKDIHSLSLQS